jgi:hypothetical protein
MQIIDHPPPWLSSIEHRLRLLLPILLIVSFTLVLTVHTLHLQHSCHPLLKWTDVTTEQCPSPLPTPPPPPPVIDPPSPDLSPDLVSIAVGAVAATGLAIAGAPVAVVMGAGFVVWLIARSLISIGQ